MGYKIYKQQGDNSQIEEWLDELSLRGYKLVKVLNYEPSKPARDVHAELHGDTGRIPPPPPHPAMMEGLFLK